MIVSPENPIVKNMEEYGYPYRIRPEDYPHCPLCRSECETILYNSCSGTVIGCDSCTWTSDSEDAAETGEECRCPVCGQECVTVFYDFYSKCVGCENCVSEENAWCEDTCFPINWHEED